MKILVIIASVVLGLTSVFGQGAFDPDCYFPTIGNGIDTIYGSRDRQALGANLRTIGPRVPGGPNQILMRGLPPQIPFLSAIDDGPSFNLQSLRQPTPKRRFNIELGAYDFVKFGHFRDTRHVDMLVGGRYPVIYWADENGDYDSTRHTSLGCSFQGDFGGGLIGILSRVYVAHLTSDSVLDVIASHSVNWSVASGKPDSVWFVQWQGGQHLFDQGEFAYEDSVLFIDTLGGKGIFHRSTYQGDFRGTGRDDLITVDDSNNWLYYKNDPPFSLQKFYDAMRFDTLLSAYENIQYGYYPSRNTAGNVIHSHRVMAKPDWDKSQDIIVRIPTKEQVSGNQKIFFFQGGEDFGVKRLTLVTATDTIYDPYHYDPVYFKDVFWGYDIRVLGDVTGTGNPVLITTGATAVFYVLGKALDDKIDMHYSLTGYASGAAIGGEDSIHVNNDRFTDIIASYPQVLSAKDLDKEWEDVGTILLIKGTDKIPVRLNPKYAVEEIIRLRSRQMYAFPNPCEQNTVLTFENCSAGVLELQVVNSIGVSVIRERVVDVDGLQQYAVDMNTLSAGAYHIRIVCPADGWSASTSVIKTGAAVAPWSLDLKKMMGR